jgi:hypothetical protein
MDRDTYLQYEWNPILRALGLSSSFARRSSGVLTGCCVFHKENNPSLHLYSVSRRYHCCGCGADGNLIEFIILYKGYSNSQGVCDEEVENFLKNVSVERVLVEQLVLFPL